MEYSNIRELKYAKLKQGDIVIFTVNDIVYRYYIENCYAYPRHQAIPETEIFDILKIDKNKFCKAMYGYDIQGGTEDPEVWPECCMYDLAALKRCLIGIYCYIEVLIRNGTLHLL